MSIIQCPECKGSVSTKAEYCPHCGIKLSPSKSHVENRHNAEELKHFSNIDQRKIGLFVGIAAIILLCAIVAPSHRADYSRTYKVTEKSSYDKAKDKAKSYTDFSGMSYDGLVDQLEFEGFSHDEAEYGANASGADWEEQALKKAKSYLNMSGFSQEGLKKQLEFEGFTEKEADYAVKHCNADWKEQAYKKAKSYLGFTEMTVSELIKQLEFEGFTYEEASYGAERACK